MVSSKRYSVSGSVASYSSSHRSPRRISISETIPSPPKLSAGIRAVIRPRPSTRASAALVQAERPGPLHQPHPRDHGAARAAQVDGLAAGPGRRRALDDGGA